MYSETAHLYDVVYESIRDRDGECASIVALLREHHPSARTLLEVPCGTGVRAHLLNEAHGLQVDGIDLDPNMVELARSRSPAGRFAQGDMVDFDLGRRYDAVLSLFSSIGYVRTVDRLRSAVGAMARHVEANGLLVIEPWFEPGVLTAGRVSVSTSERDGVKVCRMARTRVDATVSHTEFEYLIGDASGIRRASETHTLGLFTREQMRASIEAAGLDVSFDPEGFTGRGLYVARRT